MWQEYIAGNSRKSAELINSIIIGPYLETKLWDSTSLEVSLQQGRPSPQWHLPQNKNSHVFAEFTHSSYFHKNDVFVYFSSSYFYHNTFMHHSLHVGLLDAPVLQWTL